VVDAAGLKTSTKTRILAGGVNTTRQQMLRLDRGATQLPERVRRALARRVREAAKGADAILVSDYGEGVLGEEVRAVLRELASAGQPVCVDSRYQLGAFGGMTLCKPNEPELAQLTGLSLDTEGDLMRAGMRARKALGCRALVVTRGRSGMMVVDERGVELLPVYGAAQAVDVTGAGDTVIAALTVALASGAKVSLAARLANVAGALVVQKPGTATVSREELMRELRG
jgi:D-glycero-beta-D-manno-heptose-7-phosphate kinase